jgi:hypothetical protein
MSPALHTRSSYLALALGTIAVGLAIHLTGMGLGPVARDVAGDAMWAAMMLWLVSALGPDRPLIVRAGVTLLICFGVEWAQRYHLPALDAIRGTRVGGLVLGSGFDPRDFASYTAGALAAAAIDRVAGYAKARRQGAT